MAIQHTASLTNTLLVLAARSVEHDTSSDEEEQSCLPVLSASSTKNLLSPSMTESSDSSQCSCILTVKTYQTKPLHTVHSFMPACSL